MIATMRIDLLGGVEISGADPARVQGSSRAVSLLAYLVSQAGTPQNRAHLAGVLWPESEGAQARTNLRRELHHLRALLGERASLHVDGASLCWRPEPDVAVDVPDFVAACRDAITAIELEQSQAVDIHGGRALALFRGPFLPGCYDDWALTVREHLGRTCVDLCDRAADYWLTHCDPESALVFARRRVLLEPLEEPGYRLLMQAQRAAGDRSGAMRTYHRCASLLERELGVGPSPATRAELDAALADRGREWGDASIRAVDLSPPALSPDLVGREPERRWLGSAWEAAQKRPGFLVVTGDAGVGKTRLISEFAGAVEKLDALVLTTRCFAATGGVPLAPVADWLRHPHLRAATRRLDPVWLTEVHRLVPEGESLAEPGTGARAKVDAWQRVRFFEGLARAFLAVDRPLLLIVDDLQWCDKATMEWLSFLMSYAGSTPLLVAATAREDELDRNDLSGALQKMGGAGQAEVRRIDNLSPSDAGRLAQRVVGRAVADDELSLLMSATAGNPFYLVEALREAASSPGPIEGSDLHRVLTGRLARLSEPAQELLGLASAVGRDFTIDLLIEASDLDEGTVVRLVDELWRQRILQEHGRGYDLSHDLLRTAAYGAISPPHRWLLHRRLAQALELLYADRIDVVAAQLAEQYDRSNRPERALPYYERAARQATSVFALSESVRLWQRCLRLLGELPPGKQRDERELGVLLELLPPMNAWRGYASTTLEKYERRTAALGERLGLVEVRCTAAIALFATTYVQGHIAEAHGWGTQSLTLSEQCPDLTAQAHLAVAGSGLALGLLQLADGHFRLACELSGESDSLPIGTRTDVLARGWWAHGRWLLGDEAGAVATSAENVDNARLIDHPYSLAVALSYAAVTHQLLGDRSRMAGVLAELTEVCDRYDFAYYRDWARVLTGWTQPGPTGVRNAKLGIESLERDGSLARMPYWLSLLADLHCRQGNISAARATLDAAVASATEHDDRWWLPEVLRARAALDPLSRALPRLAQAVALAESQSNVPLLNRCRDDLEARGQS
ncbi:MAG: AAA family ATPase [Humibacillus sp.]|nr:AAA family ATPase [Humibacillus sp.]MDN5777441.1 AAA family ATPase [Humibacillus sp.]